MTSDCALETFKVTGAGPLVNLEGETVGGLYPALKMYSLCSDRSVISQLQAQSSSLLVGHLGVTPSAILCPPNHSSALWSKSLTY